MYAMRALVTVFATFLIAVGTQSASAAERPDAAALFKTSKNTNVLAGAAIITRTEPVNYEKAFHRGVQKLIDSIEQNQPVSLTTYGYPSLFADVEPTFGLPLHTKGCHVDDVGVLAEYSGMLAALKWYAERDQYPVNSLKKRMVDAIPQDLRWQRMTEGKPRRGIEMVVYALPDPLPELTGPTHGDHHPICVRVNDEHLSIREMYVTPKESRWAFDEAHNAVWVDAVHVWTHPPLINAHNLTTRKESLMLKRAPKGLVWHRFAAPGNEPSGNEVAFLRADDREVAHPFFRTNDGTTHDLGPWMEPWAPEDSDWAYEKATNTVWLKSDRADIKRTQFQFDLASKKIIKSFHSRVPAN